METSLPVLCSTSNYSGLEKRVARLEKITKENNTIRNVGWTIGNYCNARCKHCYSWKVRRGKDDLHNGEVDRVVQQLVNLGVETLNLGGNEPIFTNGPNLEDSVLP